MRKILKYILVFFVLVIFLLSLLAISCSFPSSLIKKNVQSSSRTLNKEGNRKTCFIINKFQFQEFDNYSDSLMINTAYSIDSKTPLYSAFTAKKDYIPGVTKKILEDRVGELKSSSKYKIHDEVSELEDTVNGESEESFEYAKYWHGYISILRPLLLIFDYNQIRILLILILAILLVCNVTMLANKNRTIACLFFVSLFSVEYFYIGLSLMNSIMFLIMMIASLILIKRYDKIKSFGLFFFIIGMCTSFFGLLDIPLLTFGGPIILYFVLKNEDGKGNFKELIKFLMLWLLGYGLMWLTKWILIDILYGRNLIETAIGQVLYRSLGGKVTAKFSICINLVLMIIPIIITIFIISYFYIRYYRNVNRKNLKKSLIFFIISILPIFWYSFLKNHSIYHYFFTYRLLFISMFALLLGIYYMCGEPEK